MKSTSVKVLVRQMLRWYNAALQDTSPFIMVLHANYAAGYLWALKDIASDNEIWSATGIKRAELESKITRLQDLVTYNMYLHCPRYATNIDESTIKYISPQHVYTPKIRR